MQEAREYAFFLSFTADVRPWEQKSLIVNFGSSELIERQSDYLSSTGVEPVFFQPMLGKAFCNQNHLVMGDISLVNEEELIKRINSGEKITQVEDRQKLLVLQAFLKWGKDFTAYIEGNFSFCIVDLKTREIIGVRDHVGMYQFYYQCIKNGIVISNTLKGIQLFHKDRLRISRDFIVNYLLKNLPSSDQSTIFSECKVLPSGHILSASEHHLGISSYWKLKKNILLSDSNDKAYELKSRIENSIKKSCKGEKRIIVQLSGGLDSSAILALLAVNFPDCKNRKILAISRIFKKEFRDKRRDEHHYAEMIARACGVSLICTDEEETKPLEHLGSYFQQIGNIPYNPFFAISGPIYQAIKKSGIEFVLTGFGGDEIVSMPGTGIISYLWRERRIKHLVEVLSKYSHVNEIGLLKICRSLILPQLLPRTLLQTYHRIKYPCQNSEERVCFLRIEARSCHQQENTIFGSSVPKGTKNLIELVTQNVLNGYFQHYHEAFFYASLTHGIRFAHPYINKDIILFIAGLDPLELFRDGWKRSFFRRAMSGILPEKIRLRRDKSVFSLPYENYILASRDAINDLLADNNCSAWECLDRKKLSLWVDKLCEKPESICDPGGMALKTAMAVNVAEFHRFHQQQGIG